jgi:hypothetical protein
MTGIVTVALMWPAQEWPLSYHMWYVRYRTKGTSPSALNIPALRRVRRSQSSSILIYPNLPWWDQVNEGGSPLGTSVTVSAEVQVILDPQDSWKAKGHPKPLKSCSQTQAILHWIFQLTRFPRPRYISPVNLDISRFPDPLEKEHPVD